MMLLSFSSNTFINLFLQVCLLILVIKFAGLLDGPEKRGKKYAWKKDEDPVSFRACAIFSFCSSLSNNSWQTTLTKTVLLGVLNPHIASRP